MTGSTNGWKLDATALIDAVAVQRWSTVTLLGGLSQGQWDIEAVPGWRVREVVAHLIAIDQAAVSGRLLPQLRAARTRADIERWNDAVVRGWPQQSPEGLHEELARAGDRVASWARRVPPLAWRVPVRTAFGSHPLRVLLARRVVDEWVHAWDVATAVGVAAPAPGMVPRALATGVLATWPSMVLPRVQRRAGVLRLEVDVSGRDEAEPEAALRVWGVDFARRHYGPRVRLAADATARLHATTLALLAEGRLDWRGADEVEVEGDEEVAAGLLDEVAGT